MNYEEGLAMAQNMKDKDAEILEAIHKVQADRHGVVALKFSEGGTKMKVEVLDLPYEPDVRVYPS